MARERVVWERENCPTCDGTGVVGRDPSGINQRTCNACPSCADCDEPTPIYFQASDGHGHLIGDTLCPFCAQEHMREQKRAA